MRQLCWLAAHSAWNRRYTLGLVVAAIALSVALLSVIERLRTDLRASFAQAVSGTDLIVGARSSPLQLVLYAVFRMGAVTHEMSWDSAQAIARHPAVAWAVPVTLGDGHRGYPVLGAPASYFQHFRYGAGESLRFATGRPYRGLFEAVLGAEVAERLGYRLGQRILLAHGHDPLAPTHADKPFTVVGILARTGTPVDRTVHIGLEAIEAIHLDWQGGAPIPGLAIPPELVGKFDLTPKSITTVLLGLKSRAQVFAMQRWVETQVGEPLMAVLPGVVLDELWQMLAVAEHGLLAVSALVAGTSLIGLVAVILAGLNERRRSWPSCARWGRGRGASWHCWSWKGWGWSSSPSYSAGSSPPWPSSSPALGWPRSMDLGLPWVGRRRASGCGSPPSPWPACWRAFGRRRAPTAWP